MFIFKRKKLTLKKRQGLGILRIAKKKQCRQFVPAPVRVCGTRPRAQTDVARFSHSDVVLTVYRQDRVLAACHDRAIAFSPVQLLSWPAINSWVPMCTHSSTTINYCVIITNDDDEVQRLGAINFFGNVRNSTEILCCVTEFKNIASSNFSRSECRVSTTVFFWELRGYIEILEDSFLCIKSFDNAYRLTVSREIAAEGLGPSHKIFEDEVHIIFAWMFEIFGN